MATASLIGGIFGRGGGAEVTSSQILRALEKRFGKSKGRQIWYGFPLEGGPRGPHDHLRPVPLPDG